MSDWQQKHLVYCWELGAGFGHVTRINSICNDESLSGARFSFILKDVTKSSLIAKCDHKNLFAAPIASRNLKELSPNFSHIMHRSGWDSPASAQYLICAWLNLFELIKPDLLILDHAPSAAIAAKIAGFDFRHIGNGFEIPPSAKPMPSILRWQKTPTIELNKCDNALNRVINSVFKYFGKEQESIEISQLFSPENSLIVGSPLSDHYGKRTSKWRYLNLTSTVAPSLQSPNVRKQGKKPSLFFYLNGDISNIADYLITYSHHFNMLGYLNNAPAGVIAKLESAGIECLKQMANLEQLLPMVDLVLCHGGAGTIAQALKAQKPMVLMPVHAEQMMSSYQLQHQKLALALNNRITPQQCLALMVNFFQSYHTNKPDYQALAQSDKFFKGTIAEFLSQS